MISIEVADHVFCIDNRYPYMEKLCSDYITNRDGGTYISVSDEDMDHERFPDAELPREYYESTAIYRKICELLIEDDYLLFHSSAVSIDGKGVLFGAPSGTGKSTHAGLWREAFGERVVILNDDKPLIHIDGNKATVYGTPWAGKHSLQKNTSAPVEALFLIERAELNSVEPLTLHDAYPMALNQTYRPDDALLMKKTLDLLNGFLGSIPIYRFKCNISEDAVYTAYSVIGDRRDEA